MMRRRQGRYSVLPSASPTTFKDGPESFFLTAEQRDHKELSRGQNSEQFLQCSEWGTTSGSFPIINNPQSLPILDLEP